MLRSPTSDGPASPRQTVTDGSSLSRAATILLLFYAGMGMCLAWIYRRSGTLWAPIATHATNNLIGCGLMIAGYGG